MLNTRYAVSLRTVELPDGYVSILRELDGRILVKRFAARGKVMNIVDRYERASSDGSLVSAPFDMQSADSVVDSLLSGRPWSDSLIIGMASTLKPIEWTRSTEEHRYTSTGIKFWRHREAMESYRAGGGRSVISTHISPEGACNLRCSFCSVTYRDTHSRISFDRIQRYVADLTSRGLKAVILTGGGEPTLYPQFNELVQWIKAGGLSVALITNGTTADRIHPKTWKCFSWVRVSINVFDGWRDRISVPRAQLRDDCVVGSSFVYSVEHEAVSEAVPIDRVDLFRQVAEVATKCGAEYVRVLPNCLLPQDRLIQEHHALRIDIDRLGDRRFFQQYKTHAAPGASVCHQAYFRPYLSEEPWHVDGEPGTVYPCDSVVLNDSIAHFGKEYQICKPENVLDFMDGKIAQRFDPRKNCSGCVFTGNVNQLSDWKENGTERFEEFMDSLVHEEFV